jgi:hypothetical protein
MQMLTSTAEHIEYEEKDCTGYITWVGDMLSSPVLMHEGDILKVSYLYREYPDTDAETIDQYILETLTLADQRDEADQVYPPKNWNVHLIEEDDPLFSTIVSVKHPFNEKIIFGQIRTEFPYSENIYNMEEYNGSTRDSTNPCDIDKRFIDPCGSCLSSKYIVDIAVEEMSNERMSEARDILKEYAPFHNQPHSINFEGEVNDYVVPPIEEIQLLMTFVKKDFVISGGANATFCRAALFGDTLYRVNREELSQQFLIMTGQLGNGYNEGIYLISPDVRLNDLGISIDKHVFEILAPSPHAGTYKLSHFEQNTARVETTVMEPINQSAFTFRISNTSYYSGTAIITQMYRFSISDSIDFWSLSNIKTVLDTENNPTYATNSWYIMIPSHSATAKYRIIDIDQYTGDLEIEDDDSIPLPTVDGAAVSYTVFTDNDAEVVSSTSGTMNVNPIGKVDINDNVVTNLSQLASHEDYIYYNSVEYPILSLEGNQIIYIDDYDDGDAVGVSIRVRKRRVDNEVGYFGYGGLKLQTSSNLEVDLGILNGINAPTDPNVITDDGNFKENYLIQIGDDYYKMEEIDGVTITLSGLPNDWMTLAAGGTPVGYNVLHVVADQVEVQFTAFSSGIDRRGEDVVMREITSTVTDDVAIVALQTGNDGVQEMISQEENISFTIQWRNGNTEEGVL